uniref:Uncharacterized protein n=1 Tax=Cryptococcus bacillisporus CA1280 TaxID=1296109 RepID=A0A0D0VRK4_CRYGA|nr:hypothetical protein I312_02459 [Cryptococcus bacillisporus CA1280]
MGYPTGGRLPVGGRFVRPLSPGDHRLQAGLDHQPPASLLLGLCSAGGMSLVTLPWTS